ncbi:TonB-dependent receptor [Flammeovirga yaeyamensis]|uniref:TonB-dependent receptor n=1 Tax=Flammeovirga yaeyamensis TaxID=367791 RepID=A0AAX1N1F8_9BACT|nr:TonB-dependent receptor [Flammeovirga yaeyamensis]MBB3698230.1 outer membrane receptor for ferrienterochelin and colicins [Flammeovirga yaeyamensis]NMF34415.1 TonB-dependent receptor [Flammeovirga yaeyamensis]QWG01394.1 TonB-dependent receptor [Flammeovirga yaeyamensis]
MRKLIYILFFIFPYSLWAQQNIEITVVDDDRLPLPGANVCLLTESGAKSYFVTNVDGQTNVSLSEKTFCTVSYMGFKTAEVELSPSSQNTTVKMKLDLLMLDQVVKTASVQPQTVDESIYRIQVIDGKQLEKIGAQTVQDALRFQPNINLAQDGVLGSKIIMQGLEGQHVKILIDGMPVVGRQGGDIDLGQLDVSSVDHIEVIEGPMSVIYGSNALAGTINIITKENKYKTLNASAKTYYESVGLFSVDANVSGAKNQHKWGVNAGTRLFNGFNPDESTRAMSFNPKDQYNADVYYGYKWKGWNTKVGGRFSREDLQIVGNYTNNANPIRAFDNYYTTDRGTVYGQFNKNFSNGDAFQGMISYNTYDRTGQTYFLKLDEGTKEQQGDDTYDAFQTWNARMSYEKRLNDWFKFDAGYELTDETGQGSKMKGDERLTENSLWTQLNIELNENWSLQPGARFIHHNQFDAPLIYSAHVKYQNEARWTGRLSFAKGFRAPSLKEMYMHFVDANHEIYGNPDLIPETSYSATANLNKDLDLSSKSVLRFEATGFYNHLFDVIDMAQGEGNSFVYMNISQKKTQGGTFKVSYNFNNQLKVDGGVTLTGISYDLENNGNFDFRYSTDFVSSLSYFWPSIDLSTRLDYKYTGKRTQLLLGTDEDNNSVVNEGYTDAYSMLNFSTTKNFKNKRYSVSAGVKNILDVTNVNNTASGGAHSGGSSSLIAWGRTYFVSLKINLNKK